MVILSQNYHVAETYTQPVFLPCVQYVAVHCDNFKFKTVLSLCDLAYSFDSLRRYSDQLGL